ncbi:MAG: ABC transporter substrate-binding protein [Desulfosarcinaceae bacterium]|nr:ABC transporter substrate-binding protein [Desulfosarcinaceae bacterium]
MKTSPRRPTRYPCLQILILLFLLIPLFTTPSLADNWQKTLAAAKGQTVDWFMWGGSPAVNAYVNGYVADALAARYDVKLRQVPVKDIAEIVSKLLVEKQAGKNRDGKVDLMWINGENFRTCKRHGLLHGPFAHQLPNLKYVDTEKPAVKNDFGEPVEGLESPWGSAQVVMIYDTARTPEPPRSVAALIDWIRAHPGRFAYPAPPDFTGSVFVRHLFYHVAGSVDAWQGDFDRQAFAKAADNTYALLRELAPALWRQGSTYPESPVRMAQLFADGEIDFSFSYHQAEASKKIHDGLFPDTVRTYVFDEGTIANTHFVAIPFNAADTAGAKVVANFLLSPEAQLKKADPAVWGDFPVLEAGRLPEEWQQKFAALERGPATLPDAVLQGHQLPEPPSEILIELEKGWQRKVLKAQ